ncbi:sodium/potassium-transporting ATPase subunit alpha-B-like isoform X2 [Maniola jurtina]|uniref:sodium/potassium-transporting ATPase subunit alpha-B-like isoform X2 n=1 Tax=Maniola jurtina TaxID=191418 RepID=UPI001E68A99D|nr:sodium/potassium-transporting ATPase subunit alpha-B-like isoform X2 [Maniola jurtina]
MNSKSSSLSSISDLFRPTNPRGLRSRDLSSTRLSVLKQEIQTDTHLIPLKNLYTLLGTDPINGLTNNRAKELLEYYGPNTLTPTTQFLWPRLLFKSLCTGFSIVIWLGAILCLTAYLIELSTKPDPRPDNLYLGCVLIAVDLICGLFSFFQNYKSSQILKTFNSMIPMYAKCTRDGVLTTDTEVHNLVKGDIVYVEIGDVIPADIRIIESKGFKVDNSSLTGECIAVSRSNTDGTPNILESPNVAFSSALCVEGWAKGLQPTVTASLTLTAKRMVAKQCLIKNLEAIEALGACTTICSDKTGTLTENKMCVRHIWMPDKTYSVLDDDFDSSLQNNQAFISLKVCGALCSNASVSSSGVMRGDASEKAILNFLINFDDPIAIRKMYPKVAEIPFNSVNKYQVSVHLDTSTSKFLVVIKGAPECIVSRCLSIIVNNEITDMSTEIKEAANVAIENLANTGERILAFADCVLDPEEFPLDYKFDTENVNFPLDNLRFLGLIGLKDPPREEVRFAIQRVREAGVRVMMVTGDHPATARAVASEVGIATTPDCHVVTGTDLRNMTPDLLYLTLEKHYEIVFARTSPTQKLTIVEACQRQGGVVAVTGDGVNDAPALRRADIGISMGITGSQVSKQTADIILMDDNFATIVTGIEEGRKIFDNLKKSVCYILISNVPEIIPVLMFILFSIPLPLGVMTILCVDLGTDMWPAVSLSYEQAEQDVMARPPRTSDPLVSASMLRLAYGHLGLVEFAAGMFAYFIVMAEHGFYPSSLFGIRERWDNEAVSDVEDSLGQEWTYAERKELERACQAAYFVAVVITQMMNGVICKTRYNSLFHVGMKNNVLKMGLLVELMLACAVCYVPGVNTFFRTYPLRLRWWFLALPFAAFMFVFDEFRKYCIRRQNFGRWFNKLIYY